MGRDVIRVTHETDAIEHTPNDVDQLLDLPEVLDSGDAILWINREISKREKVKDGLDMEIEELQNLKEDLNERRKELV